MNMRYIMENKEALPLVTAIIPTYKREIPFLDRAVKSVFHQTYPAMELIIVDDNPYGTEFSQSVKAYCEKTEGVRYVGTLGIHGACNARNMGILNAKGEFVAFLDDDDTWMPEKISEQMKLISDDVVMVYCNGWRVDESKNPVEKTPYRLDNKFKDKADFHSLLADNYIGTTSQFLVRKHTLMEIGGFDVNLPARQDYDVCLRLSRKGQMLGVRQMLFNHNMHGEEQITKSAEASLKGYQILYGKFKADYDVKKKPKSDLMFVMARLARQQGKLFMMARYYLSGVCASPRLWLYGLKKVRRQKKF